MKGEEDAAKPERAKGVSAKVPLSEESRGASFFYMHGEGILRHWGLPKRKGTVSCGTRDFLDGWMRLGVQTEWQSEFFLQAQQVLCT